METRIEYLPRPFCVQVHYASGIDRIHHRLLAIEPVSDVVITQMPPGKLYLNMDHVMAIGVYCPSGDCSDWPAG